MSALRGTPALFNNEYLIGSFDSMQAMRNRDDSNLSAQLI
jgi:hypothetical protein